MSIFGDNPTTGNTAVDTNGAEDNQDYIAQIVSEKGEQWNNPQAIAKGYLHAQRLIAELKAKTDELGAQDYAKQLLAQIQGAKATEPTPVAPVVQSGTVAENTTPSPVDIERLIEDRLSKREQEQRTQNNIKESERLLVERFGTEAASVLASRAVELGLTKADLEAQAAVSPKAFMALIGDKQKKDTNGSVFTKRVGTDLGATGERDSKFYSNLRKSDRKAYYSAQVQNQMLADRVRLGDKF